MWGDLVGPAPAGAYVLGLLPTLNNANEMSTTITLHYSGSAGVQHPQKFEGTAPICNLETSTNGSVAERSTQALDATQTSEEALEIKA